MIEPLNNNAKTTSPIPAKDVVSGASTSSEIVWYHIKQMLGGDPDLRLASLEILDKRKLLPDPRAVATCVATGFGVENVAHAQFQTGVLALYGAYVSSSVDAVREVAGELRSMVSSILSKDPTFSPENVALFCHLIAQISKCPPLAECPIAASHLEDAVEGLATLPASAPGAGSGGIAAFEAARVKIDKLVEAARSKSKPPASLFSEPSSSVENYILGAVATNFSPSCGFINDAIAFVKHFDPEFAELLKNHGGHWTW